MAGPSENSLLDRERCGSSQEQLIKSVRPPANRMPRPEKNNTVSIVFLLQVVNVYDKITIGGGGAEDVAKITSVA